jgi:hypothetical protein
MTPSVARDYVNEYCARRTGFLTSTNSLVGLLAPMMEQNVVENKFSLTYAVFTIPRELFKNHLDELSSELKYVYLLIQHIDRALTGKVQSVEVRNLASSVPSIEIITGVQTLCALAEVTFSFLDVWEKIKKYRHIREECEEAGLVDKTIEDSVKNLIREEVDNAINASTKKLMSSSKGGPEDKELETGIRKVIHKLYGQIERGLIVEIKTSDETQIKDEGKKKEIIALKSLSIKLQFPKAERSPMLLADGEVIGDKSEK